MHIDHVGIVAPRGAFDDVVQFYCDHFECVIAWREAPTDVDADAIGLPGEHVRLQGAVLYAGGPYLEIHEYLTPTGATPRRVYDEGLGHFAWYSDDIHFDFERLKAAGMQWNAEPRLIDSGGLAGHWWVYGNDPWRNVVQLCHHPDPPSSVLFRHVRATANPGATEQIGSTVR